MTIEATPGALGSNDQLGQAPERAEAEVPTCIWCEKRVPIPCKSRYNTFTCEAPWQAGLTNPELLAAWKKKLPGVEPTERDLSAFALGAEVGFDRAQDLERQDWSRVHHALARHGLHPGRTDDHLADVIDRALARDCGRACHDVPEGA
jgi:hypothetical protein